MLGPKRWCPSLQSKWARRRVSFRRFLARAIATAYSLRAVELLFGWQFPVDNPLGRNQGRVSARLSLMKRLLPLLFLLVSFFAFAGPAGACSCAMLEPKQMLEFAPTAFVGTVTGAPVLVGGRDGGDVAFTFEVETVLAGEVPAVVDVTTAGNSAACGFEAAIGTRMAVFATDDGTGTLSSGLCSTTDADLAIKALGPGTPPAPGSPVAPDGAGFDWQAVWLGVGGLAVVGGVWLAGRRNG